MKVLKVFCLMAAIAVFASQAIAATVTINGQSQITCNGSLILNSMQVNSAGDVALNVTCSGGTCTPTSGSVSPLSIVRSIQAGSTAASQSVSVTDNCGTALGYSASVTSGSNFISLPSSSGTSPMTVTFNTANLAAGSYAGTIQVTPSGYTAQNISVSITVSTTPPPPPGGAVDITTSGYQPPSTNYVSLQLQGGGSNNYFFRTANAYSRINITLESLDGQTDSDLVVSTVSQPQCTDIKRGSSSFGTNGLWYKSKIGTGGEFTAITTSQPAGTTVYVTVCNFTTNLGSRSRIYWSAY